MHHWSSKFWQNGWQNGWRLGSQRFYSSLVMNVAVGRVAAAAAAAGAGAALGAYSKDDAAQFLFYTKKFTKPSSDVKFDNLDQLRTCLEKTPIADDLCVRFHQVAKILEKLDTEMVGMQEIKNKIMSIAVFALVGAAIRKDGSVDPSMMNILITAPPGCGKTTVANIIAEIFVTLGVCPLNKITAVSRKELIAGHVGGTTEKTNKILEEGKGGVIILDEFHALADELAGYGPEGIAAIVADMTANKHTRYIMLAYPNVVDKVLDMDPGLRRRIGWHLEIPEYSADDLFKIFEIMCKKKEITLSEEAKTYMKNLFEKNRASFPENGGNIETLVVKSEIQNAVNSTHYSGPSKLRNLSKQDAQGGYQDYERTRPATLPPKKKSWF